MQVIEKKTLLISNADENFCKGDAHVKERTVADKYKIECKCLEDAIEEVFQRILVEFLPPFSL